MVGVKSSSTKRAREALFALDMSGIKFELAEVQAELKLGEHSREELGALEARRKNALACRDLIKDERLSLDHEELIQELRLTREAMKHQGSGATNFDSDTLSLPRRAGEGSPSH